MTEDDRSTALGFYHYAHAYAISAYALADLELKIIHADAPIRNLFRHAIELYLKAYLRHSGMGVREIRDRFGHRMLDLFDEAVKRGLQFDDRDRALMGVLEDHLSDRYLVTGARRVLSDGQCVTLCRKLNNEIGVPIYMAEGLRRSIPKI